MAERQGEVRAQTQAKNITLLKKFSQIEIEVMDDGDTHTVVGMTNIDNVKVADLSDASTITADIAGNVVTINDGAVSGAHVLITVVGT